MHESLPFCQIKLQFLSEMTSDAELDDNSLRVALYLVLNHADHQTGEARPTFETIGKAIGKDAKSVKRALNKPRLARYFEIERGTNIGNSSRYRPTEAALRRSSERRKEADKIVPLSRAKGGQKYPDSGTSLSGEGGHNRPPNLDQEFNQKTRTGEFVFVPTSSKAAQEWQSLCDRHIGTRLVHLTNEIEHGGQRGFFLPSLWPPADRVEWPAMARYLRSLRKGDVAEVSNA